MDSGMYGLSSACLCSISVVHKGFIIPQGYEAACAGYRFLPVEENPIVVDDLCANFAHKASMSLLKSFQDIVPYASIFVLPQHILGRAVASFYQCDELLDVEYSGLTNVEQHFRPYFPERLGQILLAKGCEPHGAQGRDAHP